MVKVLRNFQKALN